MSTTEKSLFWGILLETRKAKDITQYRLAKLTGLSERHLNYIERGVREPRLITIIRLAVAMDMLPGELVNAYAARLRQVAADELEGAPGVGAELKSVPDPALEQDTLKPAHGAKHPYACDHNTSATHAALAA